MESPDELIGLLQSRVNQASAIKNAFPDDPAMAATLIRCMIDNTAGGVGAAQVHKEQRISAQKEGNGRVSHWDRTVEHFRATGNKYISIPKLAKALGIHRGIASGLIYNAHRDAVESIANPKRRGGKLWRLKVAPQQSLPLK